MWNAVHGQLVLQQLMSACGIAAHDVLTDEEVEDSEEEDDSLSDFSQIDVRPVILHRPFCQLMAPISI